MSRIWGQDTAPELPLQHALHVAGLQHRLHVPGLPDEPDLVFPRWGAVVVVTEPPVLPAPLPANAGRPTTAKPAG